MTQVTDDAAGPPEEGVRARPRSSAQHDRLLPWIAAERTLRAIVLIAIGIALLTHTHTHWGGWLNHLARSLGFDPGDNTLGRIAGKLNHLTPSKIRLYGLIAVGYGILESAEAYGLWRRRRWGEYLTILATTLLLIPEIDEIIKTPSVLKALGLALNLAVIAYLIVRLRRGRPGTNRR